MLICCFTKKKKKNPKVLALRFFAGGNQKRKPLKADHHCIHFFAFSQDKKTGILATLVCHQRAADVLY